MRIAGVVTTEAALLDEGLDAAMVCLFAGAIVHPLNECEAFVVRQHAPHRTFERALESGVRAVAGIADLDVAHRQAGLAVEAGVGFVNLDQREDVADAEDNHDVEVQYPQADGQFAEGGINGSKAGVVHGWYSWGTADYSGNCGKSKDGLTACDNGAQRHPITVLVQRGE